MRTKRAFRCDLLRNRQENRGVVEATLIHQERGVIRFQERIFRMLLHQSGELLESTLYVTQASRQMGQENLLGQ